MIAALLPMAFVTGLMGPYMSPIPINASMGMLISLAIAFVVTPWLALRLAPQGAPRSHAESRLERWLARSVRALLTPFVTPRAAGGGGVLGVGIVVAILASVSLAVVKLVVLKMLPFDNKSEFQVVVDMPAGTPVESDRGGAAPTWARTSRRVDEVTDYQAYAGPRRRSTSTAWCASTTCASSPEQGDLQVNLVDSTHRDAQEPRDRAAVRPRSRRSAPRHGAG